MLTIVTVDSFRWKETFIYFLKHVLATNEVGIRALGEGEARQTGLSGLKELVHAAIVGKQVQTQ